MQTLRAIEMLRRQQILSHTLYSLNGFGPLEGPREWRILISEVPLHPMNTVWGVAGDRGGEEAQALLAGNDARLQPEPPTLPPAQFEDRIGTGPPRAKTQVVYVVLRYWAVSGPSVFRPRGFIRRNLFFCFRIWQRKLLHNSVLLVRLYSPCRPARTAREFSSEYNIIYCICCGLQRLRSGWISSFRHDHKA
jgi:hypothetical protein